ncbi:MAG: hypothetical protein ACP5K9_00150 [Candidatus Micrarchaeia archaeon]
MYFFDFVNSDLGAYAQFTSRLGFRRIFGPGEIAVARKLEGTGSETPGILVTSDSRLISKAARLEGIIGVVFEDLAIRKMLMSELRDYDKFLVFSPMQVVLQDRAEATHRIRRARELFRNAEHIGVKTAIASLAQSIYDVYSSAQLAEIAKLIGASEEGAKRMLNEMGEMLYDT